MVQDTPYIILLNDSVVAQTGCGVVHHITYCSSSTVPPLRGVLSLDLEHHLRQESIFAEIFSSLI